MSPQYPAAKEDVYYLATGFRQSDRLSGAGDKDKNGGASVTGERLPPSDPHYPAIYRVVSRLGKNGVMSAHRLAQVRF